MALHCGGASMHAQLVLWQNLLTSQCHWSAGGGHAETPGTTSFVLSGTHIALPSNLVVCRDMQEQLAPQEILYLLTCALPVFFVQSHDVTLVRKWGTCRSSWHYNILCLFVNALPVLPQHSRISWAAGEGHAAVLGTENPVRLGMRFASTFVGLADLMV